MFIALQGLEQDGGCRILVAVDEISSITENKRKGQVGCIITYKRNQEERFVRTCVATSYDEILKLLLET